MVEHKFPCDEWKERKSCFKCSQIVDDIKFMDNEERKLYLNKLNKIKTHEVTLLVQKISIEGEYKCPIPTIILKCTANGKSLAEAQENTDETYRIVKNQLNVRNLKVTLSWDDAK